MRTEAKTLTEDYLRFLYKTYGEDATMRQVMEGELFLYITKQHPFHGETPPGGGETMQAKGKGKLAQPTIVKSPPK
jgi:hypothetical protein